MHSQFVHLYTHGVMQRENERAAPSSDRFHLPSSLFVFFYSFHKFYIAYGPLALHIFSHLRLRSYGIDRFANVFAISWREARSGCMYHMRTEALRDIKRQSKKSSGFRASDE